MTNQHYRALARYNRWMNRKLYALAAELSDEERRRDVGAFFKSLNGTLHHIVFGDRIWMSRFTSEALEADAVKAAENDFAALVALRERTDDWIERWVAEVSDEKLNGTFEYKSLKGEPFSHPMWWAVAHFFNHQTHHRGQATTVFMQLGRDPGVTDLIAMLRAE